MFSPGDVVQVVRGTSCCGDTHNLGNVGKVVKVWSKHRVRHIHCGKTIATVLIGVRLSSGRFGFQPHQLKKLPPLNENEDTTTEVTHNEPA